MFDRDNLDDAIGEEVADLIELEQCEDHGRFELDMPSGQSDVTDGQVVT